MTEIPTLRKAVAVAFSLLALGGGVTACGDTETKNNGPVDESATPPPEEQDNGGEEDTGGEMDDN